MDVARVRYLVDDVQAAVEFYTTHLGFSVDFDAGPAFAAVVRGSLQLLLAGPESSAARAMPDGVAPTPGGWNRIQLLVEDIAAEADRPTGGRCQISQRDPQWPWRTTGPAPGPVRQLGGAVSARLPLRPDARDAFKNPPKGLKYLYALLEL
ncbi:VOC family protein [Mycobacterium sp. Marseille-P9652]|uniref:VOC family protein n=1 Tax=Mycobacterium sp. Marseille-P9652 TaxID=2654950 RepID=UPI003519E1BB